MTLKVKSSEDIPTAVSTMLGFIPTESVAVLGLDERNIKLVARADLLDRTTPSAALTSPMILGMLNSRLTRIIPVLYTERVANHLPLMQALKYAADEAGIDTAAALFVTPSGWGELAWSGTEWIAEPTRPAVAAEASQLAAALVMKGTPLATSTARPDYLHTLIPRDQGRVADIAQRVESIDPENFDGAAIVHAWEQLLAAAHAHPSDAEEALTNHEAALLLDALKIGRLRDAVLCECVYPHSLRDALGDDGSVIGSRVIESVIAAPPDRDLTPAVRNALAALARMSDRNRNVFSILAFLAWWEGNTSQASDLAEVAQGEKLADLVDHACAHLLPPPWAVAA